MLQHPGSSCGFDVLLKGLKGRGIEGGREHWLFTPKLKWLNNWDCLGFGGIKKKEWSSIIVGWLCPQIIYIYNIISCKEYIYINAMWPPCCVEFVS